VLKKDAPLKLLRGGRVLEISTATFLGNVAQKQRRNPRRVSTANANPPGFPLHSAKPIPRKHSARTHQNRSGCVNQGHPMVGYCRHEKTAQIQDRFSSKWHTRAPMAKHRQTRAHATARRCHNGRAKSKACQYWQTLKTKKPGQCRVSVYRISLINAKHKR
jgi:hypothetical protein